ncbi:hypothetical protein BH10PLA2_BH10PLA2_34340 [soil metagenome]
MDRMHKKLSLLFTGLWIPCLLAGCQKEEIQSYLPPKPVELKEAPEQRDGSRERMLAAVIPHDDENWYLKLQGPEAVVAAHKAEFDEVLRTFHFVDKKDQPAEWTTPKGWKKLPATERRYATLELEDEKNPLQITVTMLPGGGMVVPNINRWRKQLGLNWITAMDLPRVSTEVKIASGKAIAVDIVGVPDREAAMPNTPEHAGVAKGARPAALERKSIDYTLPAGWIPLPDKGGAIRTEAAFAIKEGNQNAVITVTILPGDSGSLESNIDRWRRQLDLPAGKGNELKPAGEVTVSGIRSPLVDITAPAANGVEARRMLVALVSKGDGTWYFKMTGSAEIVKRQKTTFEAFLSSVRFQGGPRG